MEDNNKKPKRVSKKVVEEEITPIEETSTPIEETSTPIEETSTPIVEKSTNDEEYKALYAKRLPYIVFVDYLLSEEEKETIKAFNENNMSYDDAITFKQMLKTIYDETISISSNCGACVSILRKKLIKLKTLTSLQDDYFKA